LFETAHWSVGELLPLFDDRFLNMSSDPVLAKNFKIYVIAVVATVTLIAVLSWSVTVFTLFCLNKLEVMMDYLPDLSKADLGNSNEHHENQTTRGLHRRSADEVGAAYRQRRLFCYNLDERVF